MSHEGKNGGNHLRGRLRTYRYRRRKPVFERNPIAAAAFSKGCGPQKAAVSPGRNDPCPCGSGQKFKRCCL